MLENGREKFGADTFSLSEKTMRGLMPFQVKRAGEETCVCVHHLKWEKMVKSYSKQRRKLDCCDCDIPSSGHEARKMLTCEKVIISFNPTLTITIPY